MGCLSVTLRKKKQLREIFQRNSKNSSSLKHWSAKHLIKLGRARYSPQYTWRSYIWDKTTHIRKMSCSSRAGFQVYFSELHWHYINRMNYVTVLSSPAEKARPYFMIQASVFQNWRQFTTEMRHKLSQFTLQMEKGEVASQGSIYWLKRINRFLGLL